MALVVQFETASDFGKRLRSLDDDASEALITGIFTSGQTLEKRIEEYQSSISNSRRELIESRAINEQLKRNLSSPQEKNVKLLKSSAIDQYCLSEAEKLN